MEKTKEMRERKLLYKVNDKSIIKIPTGSWSKRITCSEYDDDEHDDIRWWKVKQEQNGCEDKLKQWTKC